MILLTALSLAAAISLTSCASATQRADCGLSKSFQITTRSELFALATGSSSPLSRCPEEIKVAIEELNLIVDDNENICSQEKADRIRDFHIIYLADSEQRAVRLPKAVRQFFVGYALKVSQQCRKSAIGQLLSASNSLLKPEDFEVINRFTNDKSLLGTLISNPSDYNSLVLPKNLIRLVRSGGERAHRGKLFLQVSTIKTVANIKRVCANKFKPIYEKLLLPLITLSHWGYNFGDSGEERSSVKRNQVGKRVFQWYRIVLLCEVVYDAELISSREGDQSGNLVRILTKEEAERLRKTSPDIFSDRQQEHDEAPISYEPNYAIPPQLDDLVVDADDKALIRKIKSLKSANVVSRFLHKAGRAVKEQLSRGLLELAISRNALMLNDVKQISSADDLIRMIDDYIHDEESRGESAVAAGRPKNKPLRVLICAGSTVFAGIILLLFYLGGAFG